MEDKTKTTCGGWCGCCDSKDEKCRCICHKPLLRNFFKALLAFVVLIFVFAAGVWVGKLSSWWHSYKSWYRDTYGYQMMQPRQNMMQQYIPMNSYQQWGR